MVQSVPSLTPKQWFRVESPKEAIDLLSKASFVFVAIAYTAGLLILNFYFGKRGISYQEFSQSRYLVAGVVWIFLTALSGGFPILFWYSGMKEVHSNLEEEKRLVEKGSTLGFLWALVLIATLIVTALALRIAFDANSYFDLTVWAATFALVIFNGMVSLTWNFMKWLGRKAPNALLDNTTQAISILLVMLVVIAGYARTVFPSLAPAFGGAKQQIAELIVKPDRLENVRRFGFLVSPDSMKMEPVYLILEGETFYIVEPLVERKDKVQSIRFSKELFDGVVVLHQ